MRFGIKEPRRNLPVINEDTETRGFSEEYDEASKSVIQSMIKMIKFYKIK